MEKNLVILIFILTFQPTIYSQIIQSYGIKIGYVNSSESFNNSIDDITQRKNGYSISAFVDLFNLNGFSISPELKYIQKGVGIEFVLTGAESPKPIGKRTDYVYHNYFSIPISLIYKVHLGVGVPFIKVAPRYDILLSSDDDFNSPPSTYDDYKNVFGGTFSIGFIPKFNIGFFPFLELSYHLDFTDSYSNINTKIKNNALEINLGILFK